jgi:hypothetical protein
VLPVTRPLSTAKRRNGSFAVPVVSAGRPFNSTSRHSLSANGADASRFPIVVHAAMARMAMRNVLLQTGTIGLFSMVPRIGLVDGRVPCTTRTNEKRRRARRLRPARRRARRQLLRVVETHDVKVEITSNPKPECSIHRQPACRLRHCTNAVDVDTD